MKEDREVSSRLGKGDTSARLEAASHLGFVVIHHFAPLRFPDPETRGVSARQTSISRPLSFCTEMAQCPPSSLISCREKGGHLLGAGAGPSCQSRITVQENDRRWSKGSCLSYLSKAMFLVSREVLRMGEVSRRSTSLFFGTMESRVSRLICCVISKRSAATTLSSWLTSISSAQCPVSGKPSGKGW